MIGMPSAVAQPASKAAFHCRVGIAEPGHHDVGLVDQGANANRVQLVRRVVAPQHRRHSIDVRPLLIMCIEASTSCLAGDR